MGNGKIKNEICLIAPTETLAQRAKIVIEKQNLPISIYVSALDEAVAVTQELVDEGVWLFISRKATRHALEEKFGVKTVGIQLEASDYIPAMERAKEEDGLIAFFSFEEITNELKTICYLMGIKMNWYQFTDNESCKKCVEQAHQDGAVLGIGGVVSDKYSKELGLNHIVVESSESSIHQSIETAIQILEVHKEAQKKQEKIQVQLERYENILNYTHDAIIAVDENGCVEVVNKVAKKILDPEKEPFEGKNIEDILPNTHMNAVLRSGKRETDQLMKIHDTLVSSNRIPIIVNKKIKGAVATFQDIKTVQSTEQKIRIKLHEKGLSAKYCFSDIIGSSQSICRAKELAENYADSELTIMLYGETGTGKELFAQSIHNASSRKHGPFVAVNCTALSKSLLESELFGYADSSFTGAQKGGKPGLFELAHQGTIFLDEIGELPMETQAQFLRVLQEKEVRRVGGDTLIPVDVRVIGATNRNLIERVEEGVFRKDLYYRLNALNVTLPPLNQREEDYLLIALAIYEQIANGFTKENQKLFIKILRTYQDYLWPGNIRELTNVVERLVLLIRHKFEESFIREALDEMMFFKGKVESDKSGQQEKPITLQATEDMQIQKALERNNGNIYRTAKELQISRSTLYRKLNK